MSSAPTPVPDRRIDPRFEDRRYQAHVELGTTQAQRLGASRDDLHNIMNAVDIPAAAGRNELDTHGTPDMNDLSGAYVPLEALRNWVTGNARNHMALWVSGDPAIGVPPAQPLFEDFQRNVDLVLGDILARPCWNRIPNGLSQAPADRLRGLRRMAAAMNLPAPTAAETLRQINAFMAAADECLTAMREAINIRPATPAPTAQRPVTGRAAAEYLRFRGEMTAILDEISRAEFWTRPEMSEDRANTVAQLARQLRAAVNQRIVPIPGGAAGAIQVNDLPGLYAQIDQLVDRMLRECEMQRAPDVVVNRNTPAFDRTLADERRRFLYLVGGVLGGLTLTGAGGVAWLMRGGSTESSSSEGTGTSSSGSAVNAGKKAPPPSDRDAIRPLAEGCTVTRNGDNLILSVTPNTVATVFVAPGGGGAAQKLASQLPGGNHTLPLPAALRGGAVRVRIDVLKDTTWVPTTVDIP